MGIEPTRGRTYDPSTALKAAGPTRRPDTPGKVVVTVSRLARESTLRWRRALYRVALGSTMPTCKDLQTSNRCHNHSGRIPARNRRVSIMMHIELEKTTAAKLTRGFVWFRSTRTDQDPARRATDGQNNHWSKSAEGQDAAHPQEALFCVRQDHKVGLRELSNGQHAGGRVPDQSTRPALSQPVLSALPQAVSVRRKRIVRLPCRSKNPALMSSPWFVNYLAPLLPGCRNTSVAPSRKVHLRSRDWGTEDKSILRMPVEILKREYSDSLLRSGF